jgi:hypothetical protein
MLGIGREKGVIGMDDFGPALSSPLHRRAADSKGSLGMDDVVFIFNKLLDQLFFGIQGIPSRSSGIEKKIQGRKPVDFQVIGFVDAIGKSGSVNMDFMAQLHEFFGENLGGGGNPIDAGKVGVGDEGDFQDGPFLRLGCTERPFFLSHFLHFRENIGHGNFEDILFPAAFNLDQAFF